ncbi:MAG: hypothetical protein OXH53_05015 [bacterium]|nr:hypothetical protein [bacterium]
MPESEETADLGARSEPENAEDLEFQWADPRDYEPPEGVMQKVTGSAGGSAIGAAMVALGEILEPEKVRVEIQQEDDEPEPDMPFTIDFGDLPPLT